MPFLVKGLETASQKVSSLRFGSVAGAYLVGKKEPEEGNEALKGKRGCDTLNLLSGRKEDNT